MEYASRFMQTVTAAVEEVRRETADAVTVRLDLGGAAFPYRPGQYVAIDPRQFAELAEAVREREAARGKPEAPGYYSLSSDGLDPRHLEITVKEGRPSGNPPLLSGYLVRRVARGQRIALSGPTGSYCLPERPPEGVEGFLHLCAGSGVAPNRGMIRHALLGGWPQRHLLLLQNRTEADVLFRAEWEDLAARFGAKFRARHVFSVPDGRYLSEELVRGEMRGFLRPESALAYVCGPNAPRGDAPGFRDLWAGGKEGAPGLLERLGFPRERIRVEHG